MILKKSRSVLQLFGALNLTSLIIIDHCPIKCNKSAVGYIHNKNLQKAYHIKGSSFSVVVSFFIPCMSNDHSFTFMQTI